MDSHGIFARDRSFGGGDDRGSFNDGEERGQRSWRGGGGSGGQRGWDRGGGRGYRGRGRGRGGRGRGGDRGRGWQNRGGPSKMPEEDDDGDVSMEGKRWSEKGGLKKRSPLGYDRGGIFSRLGEREGGREGGGRGGGGDGGGGVFQRLSWSGSSRGQQWHKVTILRGGSQDQNWLMKNLQSGIDAPLQPVNVHVLSDKFMFFLENSRAASQLKRLGTIDVQDDSLPVIIKPCPPPRMHQDAGRDRGGRDRDGDQKMEDFEQSSERGHGGSGFRGGGAGGRSGRGKPWERGGRGGGRGGGRDGAGRFDGDIAMNQDTTTVLLTCLGQRYDINTKSLDLSSMYHDPNLKESGVRGSMYNREFVSTVLELVGSNCPELLALDLSSNRLQHLDAYATLPSRCPNLQILNLSDNELRSVSELEKLSGMTCVTTLVVEGNPFSQSGWDLMSFANTLRKVFPNIQTLDGQDLPSPVKFDLPVSVGQLPPVQKGFVVNDQVQTLVVEFVKQYYTLYDGDNREKLFEAYSEDAVFSLCVTGHLSRRDPAMDAYMPISHNLARMKDPSKRQSLVKHGRIDIVQCLRDLPRTKHHLSAFNVDVMRATQNSTAFTIYGFFSEVGGSRVENFPVRAFTRTFVLMAVGSGIAVSNDQITLRPASQEQVKISHQELASLQQPLPLQPVQEQPLQQQALQQQALQQQSLQQQSLQQQSLQQQSLQQQQVLQQQSAALAPVSALPALQSTSFSNPEDEAVKKIAQTTSMNLEWSRKCLSENDWDFNKAVTAFTLLNGQGKIPQEAFQ